MHKVTSIIMSPRSAVLKLATGSKVGGIESDNERGPLIQRTYNGEPAPFFSRQVIVLSTLRR